MVELLIVIGVIMLLVALLVAAMAPSLENAKIAATKAVLAQIDQQLQRRLTGFDTFTSSKVFENRQDPFVSSLPNLSSAAKDIAKKKSAYRSLFPQRTADLAVPGGVTFTADGQQFIQAIQSDLGLSQISDASSLPTLSNAEMLYFLLTRGRALGSETYSIDGIPSRFIADTNNNGYMEIVDAWGNPIRFYQAPTGLFRPTNSEVNLSKGARVLFASIPGDVAGVDTPESGELYFDTFDRLGRTSSFSALGPDYFYHPDTYFSFLIVSAGPDGDLGLHEPTEDGAQRLAQPLDTGNLDPIYDNLTNHQQQ